METRGRGIYHRVRFTANGSVHSGHRPAHNEGEAGPPKRCTIVNVSAMDKDTGKRQEITIQGSSNMSREEIERAVREAQQYAAEDARARADAQVSDRLESLLYRSEEIRKRMDKEQRK